MKTDTMTLSPWADVSRILLNAKSLSVVAGGETYKGKADLSIDDQGHVKLDFGGKRKKK